MKREHRLRYIIKEGILDTFFIWKDELKNVFKDSGGRCKGCCRLFGYGRGKTDDGCERSIRNPVFPQ